MEESSDEIESFYVKPKSHSMQMKKIQSFSPERNERQWLDLMKTTNLKWGNLIRKRHLTHDLAPLKKRQQPPDLLRPDSITDN